MRWQREDGTTVILTDAGENERQVLRAVVKASFELARPAGLGFLHADPGRIMSDADADLYIHLPDRQTAAMTPEQASRNPELVLKNSLGSMIACSNRVVVDMDYVQGRQCKTILWRTGDGQFELNDHCFTRDRGLPDDMLKRAQEILAGTITQNYTSSEEMFRGENLTLRAKERGVARQDGESDWSLRRRAFLDLAEGDPTAAVEYLFGSAIQDLPFEDRLWVDLFLAASSKLSRSELEAKIRGFHNDPVVLRQQRMNGQQN